ncbi:MAG: DUF6597 domain-containing transcriptional factor [Myxococcota bacterium]
MRIIAQTPGKPLSAWVTSIWYFEGDAISHTQERILPNGEMQLLVNLERDELRWWDRGLAVRRMMGTALAGAFDQPFQIDTQQQRRITGVSFAPGGAAAFFRGSMREFANDHLALTDFPGWRSIRTDLVEAHSRSAHEVLATWVRFLLANWKPLDDRNLQTARHLLETGRSVHEVADLMSMSVRKLRSDFAESVGMAPKKYARIRRLQRLVRSIAASRSERDWAALAAEHGFFDQPHMIREFRALAGVTPMTYCPRDQEDWNHSVVSDADSYNTRRHATATRE